MNIICNYVQTTAANSSLTNISDKSLPQKSFRQIAICSNFATINSFTCVEVI